jgi:hypothetical protein
VASVVHGTRHGKMFGLHRAKIRGRPLIAYSIDCFLCNVNY